MKLLTAAGWIIETTKKQSGLWSVRAMQYRTEANTGTGRFKNKHTLCSRIKDYAQAKAVAEQYRYYDGGAYLAQLTQELKREQELEQG